jgi:hypothetical protein
MKNDLLHFEENITSSRVFYEENCLNQITMIFMRNILNMKKFLNYFKENIDNRTCRKTLKIHCLVHEMFVDKID